jgi:hypothetical protein
MTKPLKATIEPIADWVSPRGNIASCSGIAVQMQGCRISRSHPAAFAACGGALDCVSTEIRVKRRETVTQSFIANLVAQSIGTFVWDLLLEYKL